MNPLKILSRGFKSRDKPKNNTESGFTLKDGKLFGVFHSSGGNTINERTAMRTTAVYSCVRVLAEAVASLPLHVYRHRADGGKERDINHPLYSLLHDEANPEMTSFQFRETLMTHLLLWGNAYAQIIRDGRGAPMGLYPLLPCNIEVRRGANGELVYIYRRNYNESRADINSGTVTLRRDEVLHIPGLAFDGLVGYSPITLAKNAVGMAIAAEEYGASFFENGANPGGVLEHPGQLKDPERVRDSWNSVYQGSGNAHKVAVLEEGMKFNSIGIPPEQAQFLETRKFQVNEIARIFRVPPHLIGDLEKATFSNIEHQSLEFVKYTLDPWITRWEQSLRQALILPSEKRAVFIKFNLDGLLRGDYASRMQGYATGRQNGWLSANDIRDLEELNRIPAADGGDLYLINGNMTKLADAGAFAKGAKNVRHNKKNAKPPVLGLGEKRNRRGTADKRLYSRGIVVRGRYNAKKI
jgi:HK97 family phage portal protein